MAFVNPATAVIFGAVDSHHLLGLYRHVFARLSGQRPAKIKHQTLTLSF